MARRTGDTGRGWLSSGSLAAFAGGAVLAVIATRVLPPLLAQATGSARAAAGRDPFDVLVQDHRIILSLLTQMERSSDDAVLNRTQLFLRLKRRLAAHAMAEEDIVYPLLHDRTQEVEDTKRLYSEHGEMKMRLFALEQMPKNDPRWRGLVSELKMLIAEHVHQEEEIDFPKLRAASDNQTAKLLAGGVQREKALLL